MGAELREYIDYVIYIDIQPEIALGRRAYDLVSSLKSDPAVLTNLLEHYFNDYLYRGIREMYMEFGRRVRDNADYLIPGEMELQEKVASIVKVLEERFKD